MKDTDCCSTNCGFPHQISPSPDEMFVPLIAPRIEEFRNASRFWINTGDISAFEKIAIDARQGEVGQVVSAAMAPRNDMFDVELSQGRVILAQTAVFATMPGSFSNFISGPLCDTH
jgi:hypothetical protein